jgi:hypothetical protein
VDPVPDPLLVRKTVRPGNRTRNFWICSQKLCPIDHRGGPFPITDLKNLKTEFGHVENTGFNRICVTATLNCSELVYNELGRMWRKWSCPNLFSQQLAGGAQETHENPSGRPVSRRKFEPRSS